MNSKQKSSKMITISTLIKILILLCVQTLIECKSSAEFCTSKVYNDFEVNRLQSIFTVRDKVYIRVGTKISKFWVYDIDSRQVLETPIMAPDMFPGFPIVEFVAVVTDCKDCSKRGSDLAIVIGRPNLQSYHRYGCFRLQYDGSFKKITKDEAQQELPLWGLRGGEEEFTHNAPFYGFFPESVVTVESNSSKIHGFTFFPWLQIFLFKYYTEVGMYFSYRKVVPPDGNVTKWMEGELIGKPHVLYSAFYMKEKIYAVDNGPQYMPRISHEIIVNNKTSPYSFIIKDVNVEAREFFNCYDNSTKIPNPVPIISTNEPTTIVSTIESTTQSTTVATTEATTESTTELTTASPTELTTESTTKSTTGSTTSSSTELTTTSSTTTETIVSVSDRLDSETTSIEPTPTNEKKDDYVLFWSIIGILVLIILIVIFSIIFIVICIKKRNKGDEYATLNGRGGGGGGGNDKPPVVMAGSPSSVSVRSNQDNNGNARLKTSEAENPSSISMRSYNEQKNNESMKSPVPESAASPSQASLRSTKN